MASWFLSVSVIVLVRNARGAEIKYVIWVAILEDLNPVVGDAWLTSVNDHKLFATLVTGDEVLM